MEQGPLEAITAEDWGFPSNIGYTQHRGCSLEWDGGRCLHCQTGMGEGLDIGNISTAYDTIGCLRFRYWLLRCWALLEWASSHTRFLQRKFKTLSNPYWVKYLKTFPHCFWAVWSSNRLIGRWVLASSSWITCSKSKQDQIYVARMKTVGLCHHWLLGSK